MKLLIGVLVIAAVVGAIWFFGMTYHMEVGVSPAAPLGDYAKLEKHLTGMGLRKDDPDRAEVKMLLRDRLELADDMTATAFVDLAPGMRHQVVVVRRADGRPAGVVSHFRSGSFTYSKTGTKAENFAALYWVLLAGSEPKFGKENEGGADMREYLLAKFSRPGADGAWKKESGGASLMNPQEISDVVTFVAR